MTRFQDSSAPARARYPSFPFPFWNANPTAAGGSLIAGCFTLTGFLPGGTVSRGPSWIYTRCEASSPEIKEWLWSTWGMTVIMSPDIQVKTRHQSLNCTRWRELAFWEDSKVTSQRFVLCLFFSRQTIEGREIEAVIPKLSCALLVRGSVLSLRFMASAFFSSPSPLSLCIHQGQ